MMNKPLLHPVLWLWIPVALIALQIGVELFASAAVLGAMHTENGLVELGQFFIITAAFVVAVFLLFTKAVRKKLGVSIWLGIAALASLYIAGEEVSWGQHFMNWSTPENWQAVNDQGETNLHNTSSWLDQKPRLILEIGVIIGGLIIPLLAKIKPAWLPVRFAVVYPTQDVVLTAGLFLIVKLLDKGERFFDFTLFERASEVQELFLFYFVLIYLLALGRRIKAA